jgi:UDP-GlcNAc:undecaprenyl-phosphate GlcNAc-1-phosphate transferase
MNWSRIGLLFAFAAGSLAVALVAVPLARRFARHVGLVDRPDGRRKLHHRAVPVAGGVAILVSALCVLAGAAYLSPAAADLFGSAGELTGLLPGAVAICLVGVLDDRYGLRGRYKLLGQTFAVATVLAFGVRVEAIHLFAWRIELGWFAVPFTLFWLLGAINSLNLLDGMDGLLGTVGTIVSLAIAALAALHGHWAEAAVAATLAGALIGFLRYNWPPATIFLGDAGSMLIGLVIGVLAIRCSLKGTATVALATPLALLILPIFDTAAAIVRRKLTGRSIYTTDRAHLHHCLLGRGLSRPVVLLLVSSLCLLTVVGVLASTAYQNEFLALLSAAAVVAVLVATRLFGHAECVLLVKSCGALARSLAGGVLRSPHQVEVRLQGSVDWHDYWGRLTACAERLNLSGLTLDVNAPAMQEGYHARWYSSGGGRGAEEPEAWSADVPLSVAGRSVGRITLTGPSDGEPMWRKVAAVAEVAEQIEAMLDARANAGAAGKRPKPAVVPAVE